MQNGLVGKAREKARYYGGNVTRIPYVFVLAISLCDRLRERDVSYWEFLQVFRYDEALAKEKRASIKGDLYLAYDTFEIRSTDEFFWFRASRCPHHMS